MPRPGPARPLITLRISTNGLQAIDTMAQTAGVTRSEMIRTLLAEAVTARQKRPR